jgi:lysozyme
MQYSKQGLALTEGFESCKLTAYQDVKGIWTCGWGHTGPEVVEGYTMTQNQADSQLVLDTLSATNTVNRLVTVPLSQPEFDGIVDLVFNIGAGNFSGSTMLKLLNAGDYTNAALEFDRWDKAGGQVVSGLLRRRQAETDEFRQA